MKKFRLFFVWLALGLACQPVTEQPSAPVFQHVLTTSSKPWNSEVFQKNSPLTFAIISDLTGGEREGIFQEAVTRINLLYPAFVLSVGDLIDGGTEDLTVLREQFDFFDQRADRLEAPFFHLGGNHDLTNPIMRTYWEGRYGARYYHFVYDQVLFLMMDSEDYEEDRMLEIYQARAEAIAILDGYQEGRYEDTEYYHMKERSTGAMSQAQLDYFKSIIASHPEVTWTFLLMHKPVWMKEDSEFAQLEAVLTPGKYTVINGHFHSYSHRTLNQSDYIMLGTTGGSQRPGDSMAFDHFVYVTMKDTGPSFANLKLEGIVDKRGQ